MSLQERTSRDKQLSVFSRFSNDRTWRETGSALAPFFESSAVRVREECVVVRKTLLLLAILGLSRGVAEATAVTVDQVLYDSTSVVDSSLLSGTVDMSLSGNVLTIILTNTSLDGAGSGAGILLTGIGFELPTGVSISSGSANIGSSTAVNFAAPASGDISSEWGYDNTPLNSGFFLNNGVLSYNTVVSSMVSMTTNQFASGSLGQPPGLGGPDFGAISALETD